MYSSTKLSVVRYFMFDIESIILVDPPHPLLLTYSNYTIILNKYTLNLILKFIDFLFFLVYHQ